MNRYRVSWYTKPAPRVAQKRGEEVVDASDDDEAWDTVVQRKTEELGRTVCVNWVALDSA